MLPSCRLEFTSLLRALGKDWEMHGIFLVTISTVQIYGQKADSLTAGVNVQLLDKSIFICSCPSFDAEHRVIFETVLVTVEAGTALSFFLSPVWQSGTSAQH